MNQVFKNVLGKLVLGVAKASDSEGRASVEALQKVESCFAK